MPDARSVAPVAARTFVAAGVERRTDVSDNLEVHFARCGQSTAVVSGRWLLSRLNPYLVSFALDSAQASRMARAR